MMNGELLKAKKKLPEATCLEFRSESGYQSRSSIIVKQNQLFLFYNAEKFN